MRLENNALFRTLAATAALCACALAQPPASPTFEVASIKPAAPQEMGRMMVGISGGPRKGSRDPGQMTFTNVSLSMLVSVAYDVKDYQVHCPDWMNSARFDIVAKVPKGATEDDTRVMMQNLLAERFKVKIHKDSKEMPIYALTVGKNGIKMQESPKEAPPDPNTSPDGPRPDAGPAGGRMGPPQRDKDGFPVLRGGRGNLISMGPGGKLQMVGGRVTMPMLCNTLGNQLGRPVVDMTGLKAEYDYKLEFSAEGLAMMKGMPAPPPGAMHGPEEGSESGPNLITAVQEQLGLRLESRKGPVDYIVDDSAEKTPTEN
jgi:uncharacterized protein (TIGR03435 family)